MIAGFEAHEAIDAVKNWAADNPKFDVTFVESLESKLEEYDSLTDSQEAALENIINKFRIDVAEYI